jgi:hypothetical protein
MIIACYSIETITTLCCRCGAHFDITFSKIRGREWVTLGMHLFDPFMRCMVTLATMDFEAEQQMSVDMILLFLSLVDKAVLKHCEQSNRNALIRFDPRWLISDGQGSIWQGLRQHLGDGSQNCLEGREQTCKFHFEQGITRLTLEMFRQGYEEVCDIVRISANNMVMNEDQLVCHDEYKRRFSSHFLPFIFMMFSLAAY